MTEKILLQKDKRGLTVKEIFISVFCKVFCIIVSLLVVYFGRSFARVEEKKFSGVYFILPILCVFGIGLDICLLNSDYYLLSCGVSLVIYVLVIYSIYSLLYAQKTKILTDKLTNLHNRYGMNEEIREQLHQYAKDKNDSFYLIVCDLDNFKHINDTWGHLEGDRALILISSALLKVSEKFNSEVFRMGGDEFVIITDTSEEGLADNIIESIQEELDMIDFRDDFDIRMSMGVSLYDGETHVNDLIESADKKMYEVKKKVKTSV